VRFAKLAWPRRLLRDEFSFREVPVLVDPATSTQPELLNVTDVIAHELAHNFGTIRCWASPSDPERSEGTIGRNQV